MVFNFLKRKKPKLFIYGDQHDSAPVQRDIADAIDLRIKNEGLRVIFVEGRPRDIQHPDQGFSIDDALTQNVIYQVDIENGRTWFIRTGAENDRFKGVFAVENYLVLMYSPDQLKVIGAEDPKYWAQRGNIQAEELAKINDELISIASEYGVDLKNPTSFQSQIGLFRMPPEVQNQVFRLGKKVQDVRDWFMGDFPLRNTHYVGNIIEYYKTDPFDATALIVGQAHIEDLMARKPLQERFQLEVR